MKNMKKLSALLLAVMLLCAVSFTACGEPESTEADYKVTVADANGNPISTGYAVRFMQNGQQVAMQIPNEQGESVKTMLKGDYQVELQFTGSDVQYHYDSSDLTLSAEKTQLNIVLAYALPEESRELFVGDGNVAAYAVNEGTTYIQLDSEKRSYYLFTPTRPGMYEVSLANSTAAVGYYGAPHFVQEYSAVEVVDNKFSLSVSADNIGTGNTGTTVMVIGVDACEGDAILSIVRVGDPAWTVADEPWIVYETTATIAEFDLPDDATLVDFNLKASSDEYTLVYNETDGFYHLNTADGPLVLVRLGKKSGTPYTDPLGKMIETSNVAKYFYDEDGSFIKKETYTQCLYDYCDGEDADGNGEVEYYYYLDDETQTYPLTEDLKYIIQQRGEYAQWWDAESVHYLFTDANDMPIPGINSEIAWLFMCCYVG